MQITIVYNELESQWQVSAPGTVTCFGFTRAGALTQWEACNAIGAWQTA